MPARAKRFTTILIPTLTLLFLGSCKPATVEDTLTQQPDTLDQGLVLHLGLNGNLGDQSGHDNDGVSTPGAVPGLDRQNRENRAYTLDGTGGIVVSESASLDLSEAQAVTLATWVFLSPSPNPSMAVISNDDTLNSQALYLGLETTLGSTTATFRFHAPGGWHQVNGGSVIPVGEWVFLAATHDGTTARLYVNGVSEATGDQPALWGSLQGFTIGYFDSVEIGPGSHLKGSIDEVRLYNRALSAAEVARLQLDS